MSIRRYLFDLRCGCGGCLLYLGYMMRNKSEYFQSWNDMCAMCAGRGIPGTEQIMCCHILPVSFLIRSLDQPPRNGRATILNCRHCRSTTIHASPLPFHSVPTVHICVPTYSSGLIASDWSSHRGVVFLSMSSGDRWSVHVVLCCFTCC